MKLPRRFLQFWFDGSVRSRIDTQAMVQKLVDRLERDVAQLSPTLIRSAQAYEGWTMGAGWMSSPDGHQSLWSLIKSVYRELFYLKRVRMHLGSNPRWVIADDRRTGLISSQRRLQTLLTPLGGGALPIELEMQAVDLHGLLCFTPHPIAHRPDVPQKGVAHLSYVSLFAMPLLHPLRFALGVWQGIISIPHRLWHHRHVWIMVLLASSITALFMRHRPKGLVMTTSNSFVIELMRYMFLGSGQEGTATEVLHGIPTREIEDFHAFMHAEFFESFEGRMRFIAPLPDLNLKNFPEGSVVEGVAINLKLNDLADNGNLQRMVQESANRSKRRGSSWVVAVNGAGRVENKAYTSSGIFVLEKAILAYVREQAEDRGLPIELQYSVHPAHLKISGLAKKIAVELQGVEVLEDSLTTWLEADLCISILSSASWEARAFGCRAVSCVRPDDGFYAEELLSNLAYPRWGESIFDVLKRELDRLRSLPRSEPESRIGALQVKHGH